MNKKKIRILLDLTNPIVSVNAMYAAKVASNKKYATLYKTKKAKDFEREARGQFKAVDLSEHLEWLRDTEYFTCKFTFIFKRAVTRRDVTNSVKLIEDSWVRFLNEETGLTEYDDAQHAQVLLQKAVLPGAKSEYIIFEIEPFKGSVRFDEEVRPEYIFLGGTCAGSSWRDEISPELEKRGFKLFNPVVENWTKECQEAEEQAKTECDTDLYLITPEMKGVFSIAEMIDSAYRKGSSGGFCFVGILGKEEDWGKSQFESLKSTVNLVNRIADGKKNIGAAFIDSPTDILSWPSFKEIEKKKRTRKTTKKKKE